MSPNQPIRVLLMEDDVAQARLVKRTLERAGYVMDLARDGDAGLAMYRAGSYHLLMIDHQMPGKNGIEVLRMLTAWGEPPPTLMVTGNGDETIAVNAMKLGAGDYLVKDVEGRYLTLLPVVIERLLAQQRLTREKRQAEEQFRQLVEGSVQGVLISRPDMKPCFVNPAYVEIFGYDRPDEILDMETVLTLVAPQERTRLARYQEACLHDHPILTHDEYQGLRKDGRVIWLDNKTTVITWHGEPAIQSTVFDITERKQAQDVLRQAQKMEALGTLSGGIAHEFNNMLTAILGFTQLAQSEVQAESRVSSYLEHVVQAGSRAQDLVEQILAFSHPGDRVREPLSIAQVIQEVLTLARGSLPATIEVQSHITEAAGAVLANRSQLHQVMTNLCTNADYAMRARGGLLEIGVEVVKIDNACATHPPQLRPGPYICIGVRDTGCGMPPKVVGRIFEPFFTTKGVGEGTGMGLAIVHGIITGYGGAITVQSIQGKGSLFTLYLPQISHEAVMAANPPETVMTKGEGRLLLVDDEEALVRLGQALLERLGTNQN